MSSSTTQTTAGSSTAAPGTPGTAIARQPESKVPTRLGIAPTSVEEGWRLAQMMAASELVPKNFRGKPEDVLVAIQMGIEIGFAPMQALQSIAVINGRPGVWGDGFLALIMASPLYQDHDEYYEVDGKRRDGLTVEDLGKPTTVAVCTFWRKNKPQPVTRRFTVAQAKKAGLLDKRDTPWQTYPDRMLAMRARSFAGRDTFPDLLRGIRTAEEVQDTPPDSAAIDVQPRTVQRLSETRAPEVSAATAGAPSSSAAAPSPAVEDVHVVGFVGETETLLDGAYVTMKTGECILVPSAADLTELAKFVDGPHRVRLTCTPAGDGLTLKTFAIAE